MRNVTTFSVIRAGARGAALKPEFSPAHYPYVLQRQDTSSCHMSRAAIGYGTRCRNRLGRGLFGPAVSSRYSGLLIGIELYYSKQGGSSHALHSAILSQ